MSKLSALTSTLSLPTLNQTSASACTMTQGSPDAPRCGFSARVVASLRALDVPFGHFDILQDQIVREGLKVWVLLLFAVLLPPPPPLTPPPPTTFQHNGANSCEQRWGS